MTTKLKPYERLDKETPKAFQAFRIYRDLGIDRTIAKVAEELGKHPNAVAAWSQKHNWTRRAGAWDRELDSVGLNAELSEVEEMHRRQAKLGRRLQELGMREIERAIKIAEDNEEPLDVKETQKLVKLGTDLELLNRGEATEITKTVLEEIDYTKLSSEDLAALRKIKKQSIPKPPINRGKRGGRSG